MEPSIATINKLLEDYPALGTAMKGVVIGAVLVPAVAFSHGLAVGTAVAVGGIAVGAPIVATAAHALEKSSFAKEKPVLQKACKFVRVACETSLAIGAGLIASSHLLGISAGAFVAAKVVQKVAEYAINNNYGNNDSYTMAKNLGSGIASLCSTLALGSAFSIAATLENIFSSVSSADIVDKGKNVVAKTGSALFAASTAAFSGVCYLSSTFLNNFGFRREASAIRLIGNASLAAATVSASAAAGFAVGGGFYEENSVGTASAAVGGTVIGSVVGVVTATATALGFFGLNKLYGNIVQEDLKNVMGNNTKGRANIEASQTPDIKDKKEEEKTSYIKPEDKKEVKISGASQTPSRSPTLNSASQFGNLKFNNNSR